MVNNITEALRGSGCFFIPIFRREVMTMAVKVIRYGSKRRVTCNYCGSLLEYDKEDIKRRAVGMNELEAKIVCPNCQESVTVQDL